MSDAPTVVIGQTILPSSDFQDWRFYLDTVFSESEFHRKPRRSLPKHIREGYDALYSRHDGPFEHYHYFSAPAKTINKRLLIQGITEEFCKKHWEDERDRLIDGYRSFDFQDAQEIVDEEVASISSICYDDWLAAIRNANESAVRPWAAGPAPLTPLSLLHSLNHILVELFILTLVLPEQAVWMDCTPIYDDEYEIRSPHQIASGEGGDHYGAHEKIIVLTEGKSDTRIIRAALESFYPEYAAQYSFINFEEFKIEGGASPLARMVKVLAGAGMKNRLIGVFDNDAAGYEAYGTLRNIKLPNTVRLMLLPDTELARKYPTEGPGGLTRMDINGAGAPIELYLGRTSLADSNGQLRPVRWSQWHQSVNRYQAVVQDKEAISAKFLKSIVGARPVTLRKRFPEMDLLLRTIFSAFEI